MPKIAKPRLTTSPLSFFRAADGHRTALHHLAPIVNPEGQPNTSVFFAYYNVFGFCLELYLKAFLSTKGKTADELAREPYRHDLTRLYADAVDEQIHTYSGLPLVHPSALDKVISIVAPDHGSYAFRYISADDASYTYFKSLEIVLLVVDDLHAKIQNVIM